MYTVIRPWTLSDNKELAAVINNPHILNNLRDGLPYPYTERDAAEFISSVLDADKSSLFAFTISHNGHCAGSITVTRNVNVRRLTGELGYYVRRTLLGPWTSHTSSVRNLRLCIHKQQYHPDLCRAILHITLPPAGCLRSAGSAAKEYCATMSLKMAKYTIPCSTHD